MNIGFIMYEWEKVKPLFDTTLRMIHEAALRGHQVSIIYPNEMAIRRTIVWANCRTIDHQDTYSEDIVQFYDEANLSEELRPLKEQDVIFLRDNPPLDNHLLNFLDTLENEVFFINSISGLRRANNKIYPATLAALHDNDNEEGRLIPLTTVSRNKKYLKQVIENYDKDKFILKPMNGYGGSGVILLDKSSTTSKYNINSLIDFYIDSGTGNNFIILQEYVETKLKGDVRVIMLNGEQIGAMRRIPASDDHRSNVHAGGSCVTHDLDEQQMKLCKILGPKLVEDGLYLVGIDLMGGKLIEVNVCSPGGFAEINEGNNTNLEAKVIDFVETLKR